MLYGIYSDCITIAGHRVRWRTGWRPNRIVGACDRLLAALMKGQPALKGVLYLALGDGRDEWDSSAPAPAVAATRLARERTRLALPESSIVYLDGGGQVSTAPTNVLEITLDLRGDDLASSPPYPPLREFGLFGGDATAARDSGFMINYVIHPRIDLAPGDRLTRKLHLTFAIGTAAPPAPGSPPQEPPLRESPQGTFGAELLVDAIDGVGATYARKLKAQGISTLKDLVRADPERISNIPRLKLRDVRAKARMTMQMQLPNVPIGALGSMPLSRIMRAAPEDLVKEAGLSAGASPRSMAELQDGLAALLSTLDDKVLRKMTLSDLVSA